MNLVSQELNIYIQPGERWMQERDSDECGGCAWCLLFILSCETQKQALQRCLRHQKCIDRLPELFSPKNKINPKRDEIFQPDRACCVRGARKIALCVWREKAIDIDLRQQNLASRITYVTGFWGCCALIHSDPIKRTTHGNKQCFISALGWGRMIGWVGGGGVVRGLCHKILGFRWRCKFLLSWKFIFFLKILGNLGKENFLRKSLKFKFCHFLGTINQ